MRVILMQDQWRAGTRNKGILRRFSDSDWIPDMSYRFKCYIFYLFNQKRLSEIYKTTSQECPGQNGQQYN